MPLDHELYVELVLRCVESVPRGCVTTYGAIAEAVGPAAGGGGPRLVGTVMANHGDGMPWWRVARADGTPPLCHSGEARAHYLEEGTPLRPSGKIDLGAAFWRPPAMSVPGPTGAARLSPGRGSARQAGPAPSGRSRPAG